MGVVNKYASSGVDPSVTPPSLKPVQTRAGHLKHLCGVYAVTNGDSATSTVDFGEIPSSCVIDPSSLLEFTGLTGVTDFDIGLGKKDDVNGYVAKSVNCLLDSADLHTAGSKGLTGITPANRAKRAWEIAGYTSDPGGNLTVMGTQNTDATADGSLALTLNHATE